MNDSAVRNNTETNKPQLKINYCGFPHTYITNMHVLFVKQICMNGSNFLL